MKIIYSFILLLLLISCQQSNEQKIALYKTENTPNKIENQPQKLLTNESNLQINTTKSKEWLKNVILDYFKSSSGDMQPITTQQYYEFKMDAINVNMETEGSLNEEEFKQKWGKKYNLDLHPIQTGFLISGQDWGKIIVKDIKVLKFDASANIVVFKLVIRDDEFQVEYHRDIFVTEENGKYLICDILEYD